MARKARLDRNQQSFAGKMEKMRQFVPWAAGSTCFLLEESSDRSRDPRPPRILEQEVSAGLISPFQGGFSWFWCLSDEEGR